MKTISTIILTIFYIQNIIAQGLNQRLDSLFKGHVDKGEIHGSVAFIMQKGKVIEFMPYGYMDVENKKVMEKDAIFRIASMTKPLTTIAALKLYEEGKFLLDEPVKKYIPEFANLKVITKDCRNADTILTEVLQRDVTIRDLFRHSGGFGYGYGDHFIDKLYHQKGVTSHNQSLQEFVKGITSIPLKFQPGSKWEYSFSIDILGYLVEVNSGKPLDKYMDEVIFKPLGMISTGFYVPANKLNKLSGNYEFKDGKLIFLDGPKNSPYIKNLKLISGGGGLVDNIGGIVTSVEDFSVFCQMLLNYGEYKGKRILNRQTVELMISNQIGEIADRSFPVSGYGLGVGVSTGKFCGKTQSIFWAGGPYNTSFSVNFENETVAIMFIQNSPWGHLGLMEKFSKIVAEEMK